MLLIVNADQSFGEAQLSIRLIGPDDSRDTSSGMVGFRLLKAGYVAPQEDR